MKTFFVLILLLFIGTRSEAQFFKKLGQKIKDQAGWRTDRKADQKINQGFDTLETLPGKINNKKKATKSNSRDTLKNKRSSGNAKPTADANDMTPSDGQVTVALSSNSVFTGGSITITGESVKYKNFTQVEITVNGPSVKDTKLVTLAADGKYSAAWTAPDKIGDYKITVKSSDKKVQQSSTVTVYALPQMGNWADDNIDAINKAQDNLKEAVAKVEDAISPNDKATLEKKVSELDEKIADVVKLFKDLNTAGKQTADLVKSAKHIPPNLAGNLSDLNNNLADNAREMKSFEKITDQHKPQDNTICEYLVMVNEACAAFSAVTNFWSLSLKTILLNITLDKAVPKAVDVVNTNGMQIDAPHDFIPKEVAKIFSIAKFDAESLQSKLGKIKAGAGIAGDVIQYATDVLMKTYCGVFKGEIKHDFTINFRNKDGVTWWKYGVVMQGALSLRYPKDGSKGKVIKMKGNIEGNATKFTFYENVAVEDGFQEGSKGKIQVIELKVIKPAAVPFVSSQSDVAGFGAFARTVVTPACFNIMIDAEYDVDANKIKIYLGTPLVDFSPAVVNQLIFVEVGADLLPYIKRMMFPIHPVFRTLGSVVRDHNEFSMDKDAKGNLSFSGKANKHLGNKTDKIEHDLNFSISARKE
ncbi:MAG: hypothetical protein JWR38_808 [Mucilaginibacter sp.]|nr:hypothetical protein [Mucilaginibacter sp.]